MRHFCGMLPKEIAPIAKVTRARVQQILSTSKEDLWLFDAAKAGHVTRIGP